jgi:hypothetical protein
MYHTIHKSRIFTQQEYQRKHEYFRLLRYILQYVMMQPPITKESRMNIREYVLFKNITLSKLAEELAFSRDKLTRIMAGKRKITKPELLLFSYTTGGLIKEENQIICPDESRGRMKGQRKRWNFVEAAAKLEKMSGDEIRLILSSDRKLFRLFSKTQDKRQNPAVVTLPEETTTPGLDPEAKSA